MTESENPLVGPVPQEVPLPNAPLVRVIGQVRFPPILSIERDQSLAPFQEAIRQNYPILRRENVRELTMGPAGASLAEAPVVWRFTDGQDNWRVSLARDFIALETNAYTSRRDFIERLQEAIEALDSEFSPQFMDRLGMRYIDRVQGARDSDFKSLVRPEMLGLGVGPMSDHALHIITDAMFKLNGAHLRTKWGRLPPKATFDPTALEPIDEECWVLDLDMFTTERTDFDPAEIVKTAESFAERVYAFFRWSVTDEFLRRFGGEI
jgi:uncharacterized protein (TIGR04255 family)